MFTKSTLVLQGLSSLKSDQLVQGQSEGKICLRIKIYSTLITITQKHCSNVITTYLLFTADHLSTVYCRERERQSLTLPS